MLFRCFPIAINYNFPLSDRCVCVDAHISSIQSLLCLTSIARASTWFMCLEVQSTQTTLVVIPSGDKLEILSSNC